VRLDLSSAHEAAWEQSNSREKTMSFKELKQQTSSLNNNRLAFWAYMAVIHISLVAVTFHSNLPERAAHHLGAEPFRQRPELGLHYFTMLDYHQSTDTLLPPNQIFFIGDSITQGLATSAVIDGGINFGIGGDTTHGVLQRLPSYLSLEQANIVILAIGLNDFNYRPLHAITGNFQQILKLIPSTVPVLISAVLPIDERVASVKVDNDQIYELNKQLQRLAKQDAKYLYIDAGPSLRDAAGNLQGQMHQGDGVHLSPKGYSLWISALQRGLEQFKIKH